MNNMICRMRHWGLLGMILCMFMSCQDDLSFGSSDDDRMVSLMGRLQQQNESRANDAGFVDGDRMGIYMVDYANGQPGVLSPTDNRATNVLYTFNATVNKWESATTLYWKDKTTPADFYGYYPGVNHIENPAVYSFEVNYQQHIVPAEGEMSNYEASDFLWGKVEKVTPTTETIVLSYKHRMAGVSVKLVMGKDFTQTEWDKLKKQVQVDNTIRTATIDLANGEPVATGSVDKSIQMMAQSDGTYRAVVVPQTVATGKSLMTITIDGKAYTHQLESGDMNYQSGKLHNFTITFNKKSNAEGYQLAFTYDGITDWLNDEMSHSFSFSQYVIIHCPEIGKLKESIANAGYDYRTMENLKVTGLITDADFEFVKNEMSSLKHLNLKDVKVKDVLIYDKWVETHKNHWDRFSRRMDNAIPKEAFYQNKNIRSIILPKEITHIGDAAFRETQLMYSTLEIPEGVTFIGDAAFGWNDYNGVELVLPLSLDTICNFAFANCAYKCEYNLSDNIRYLGENLTYNGNGSGACNFYGTFSLPSKLKVINKGLFQSLGSNGSFTGNIEIPQGVTEIGEFALGGIAFANRIDLTFPQGVNMLGHASFSGSRFNSLHFNDDLEVIGEDAFYNASIPFQITLPSHLKMLEKGAFHDAKIEGELVIPESCEAIGEFAFAGNNFTKITLPQRLEMISAESFNNLTSLTYINIPKYVDYIGDYAFSGDVALQTIICLNPEPPALGTNPFGPGGGWGYYVSESVDFDKCILQVPEQSVEKYRNTEGWKQFKNITPYHELAFNVPEIKCLDKGMIREGILRAEGAWEVAECPSWVTVSPTSGSAKAQLTIKVDEQTKGAGSREGKIVFRLKDKDYTTYTTVKQISSERAEDETIVLQTASAGADRAVPLFIVGDGYDAEEIASGKYMQDMMDQMEHFFSIEPFKTYRNYFTVSTAIACSPESGVDGVTKFESENYNGLRGNTELAWQYALAHGEGIRSEREGDCTVMVLLNTPSTANQTDVVSWNGRTVSWVGKSNDTYPFDQKSQVLREVGGIAFGKLGPEGINHFTFIKACTCPGCNMLDIYTGMHAKGWWQNVSISSKMNDLPWNRYIFHEKYSKLVDMYEGAINHARGAYRSENMSIMGNTYIPYFNTISREMIVRRIMDCAGEKFSLDEFIANDKIEIPE